MTCDNVKRNSIYLFIKRFTAIFYLVFFCTLVSATPLPQIEVVTTIPVETDLGTAGTRPAAEVWVEMVEKAKKSIDIGQFYLVSQKHERLEPVINALINAAKRGVKIRFLVSTAISGDMAGDTKAVKKCLSVHPNIQFTTFNWKKFNGGINHAKFWIIDRNEIFVGSQNFDWRSLKHIHETGLRIVSPNIAKALTELFDADWNFCRGDQDAYNKLKKRPLLPVNRKCFLVASPFICNPPSVPDSLKILLSLIDNAKEKITIQLLNYHIIYYTNNSKNKEKKRFVQIHDALIKAAKRGVKVKMLVADWNKGKDTGLKELAKVPGIQVKFVTIPPFSGGYIPFARVIHSKVLRVDNKVSWVGTSNWGYPYFFKSRNIEVVVRRPAIAKILDRLFEKLWTGKYTEPVVPQKEYKRPKRD